MTAKMRIFNYLFIYSVEIVETYLKPEMVKKYIHLSSSKKTLLLIKQLIKNVHLAELRRFAR
jgi:hypothetical protein